jgi:phospholipid/cholesterol/gamma-HCH transport system substrate-binding protein
MAQRKSIGWSQLRVGLLVIAAFAMLSVAVLSISGTSSFFGETMKITAYFPSANGLRDGAEVWVDGILVGNVNGITLNPDPASKYKVAVAMEIDEAYKGRIRENSPIGIDTIGLLGDKNVNISSTADDGTDPGKPLEDGGVIYGEEVGDIRRIIASTDDLIGNLNVLSQTAVDISESVNQGKGTLGKLITNTEIHDNMNRAVLEMKQLITDVRSGPGTAGKLINDDTLYLRLTDTVEKMDGLLAKLDHGDGTAAKLLNDPAIFNRFDRVLARTETIMDGVERGEGTFGKLLKDEALYNDFRGTVARLNSLVDSIENGNGTAGKLIKDPTLFNTLNETASEIQKLMYDIRQDPKKYLTIQFRFF